MMHGLMMSLLLTVVVCSLQDEVVSCSRLSAGVDCVRLHRAHQFSYATNIHGCGAEKVVGGTPETRLTQRFTVTQNINSVVLKLSYTAFN